MLSLRPWYAASQGHKIKNPKMQLVQRLQEIPVAVRIIISGTPIQNNLMEMHSLFDFACEVQLALISRSTQQKHLSQLAVW